MAAKEELSLCQQQQQPVLNPLLPLCRNIDPSNVVSAQPTVYFSSPSATCGGGSVPIYPSGSGSGGGSVPVYPSGSGSSGGSVPVYPSGGSSGGGSVPVYPSDSGSSGSVVVGSSASGGRRLLRGSSI